MYRLSGGTTVNQESTTRTIEALLPCPFCGEVPMMRIADEEWVGKPNPQTMPDGTVIEVWKIVEYRT
jgi:hypothetical protein